MKHKPICIINQHCYFSSNSDGSQQGKRPKWFSRELCLINLLRMSKPYKDLIEFHFMLDTANEELDKHFLYKYDLPGPLIPYKGGHISIAQHMKYDYMEELDLDNETIIYSLEDDYLHHPEWINILLEGFTLDKSFITLYDHNDKYPQVYETDKKLFPIYKDFKSKIYVTKSCHWRTIPSTTNTFSVKWKNLKQMLPTIHKMIPLDHELFVELGDQGWDMISSIPGYSNHCEVGLGSPVVNWDIIMQPDLEKLINGI